MMRTLSGSRFSNCAKLAPLLIAYSEYQLDERHRAQVESHIAKCQECRSSLVSAIETGRLLRERRPAAAGVSHDLWNSIKAEIQSSPNRSAYKELLPGKRRFPAAFLGEHGWIQALPVAIALIAAAGVCTLSLLDRQHRHGLPEIAMANAPRPAIQKLPEALSRPVPASTDMFARAQSRGANRAVHTNTEARPMTGITGAVNGRRILTVAARRRRRSPSISLQQSLVAPVIEAAIARIDADTAWDDLNSISIAAVPGSATALTGAATALSGSRAAHELAYVETRRQDARSSENRPAPTSVSDKSTLGQTNAILSARMDAVVAARPSTRTSATEPESIASRSSDAASDVSLTDLSGLARRQQDLFSYTNR